MTQEPTVVAAMLSWNSATYLERAVDSLLGDAQDAGIPLTLWIVDNGSTDGTASLVLALADRHEGRVQPLLLSRNQGTTAPRNLALRSTRSPYVLILDSDTETRPGLLRTLVDHLAAHPSVGLAAPSLFYPDGAPQESCRRFPTAVTKLLRLAPPALATSLRQRDEVYPSQDDPFDVDYAISACWLLRRAALDRVGLLDERIFYAPEDVDLCVRLWLGGFAIQKVPSAEMVHHTQRITRRSPLSVMALSHLKGLAYFWSKHRFLLSRGGLYRRMARREEC